MGQKQRPAGVGAPDRPGSQQQDVEVTSGVADPQVEAERLMREAIEPWPELTDFGFGVYDQLRKSAAVVAEEIVRERADLYAPRALCDFERARLWIATWSPTKSIYTGATSYGLKHIAGREIGYVTNGVFIAAAISIGLEVRRVGPNAHFNLPRRAWAPRGCAWIGGPMGLAP